MTTTSNDALLGPQTYETVPDKNWNNSVPDDLPETPIRLAVVVSHPIQYFSPWYSALAGIPGVVLKVFFCCKWGVESYFDRDFGTEIKWDIPLLDGYDYEFLASPQKIQSDSFLAVDNPNVGASLEGFSPDVVQVHGYAQRTMWRVVDWCSKNQVPVLLFSDSNGTAKRTLWKRAAKSIIVRLFYRHVDGAFSTGDNNRTYHEHYRIPRERIFPGTMPIDRVRLVESVLDRATTRRQIRKELGIPQDAFVVVYVGKLVPWKCPQHLLEAVSLCTQRGFEVWALMVGEGSERPAIEKFIVDHHLKNVTLAGFVNQSSIGRYYAASDLLALMSEYEPKGLTVPEAGCLGCPAILSDRVGCIGLNDSARPGENTIVYPWGDIDALAIGIARLYEDRTLYESMSKAALRIAESQDISVAALEMKKAATQLKKMGCRR